MSRIRRGLLAGATVAAIAAGGLGAHALAPAAHTTKLADNAPGSNCIAVVWIPTGPNWGYLICVPSLAPPGSRIQPS